MALKTLPPDNESSEGFTEALLDEEDGEAFEVAGFVATRQRWRRIYKIIYAAAPSDIPPDGSDPVRHAIYALPGEIRVAPAMLVESMQLTVWSDRRYVFGWKVHNQSRHADHEVGGSLTWRYTTSEHAPVEALQGVELPPVLLGPGRWGQRIARDYHSPFQAHYDLLTRSDIQAVFTLYAIRRK
jgi:hypothetical protein